MREYNAAIQFGLEMAGRLWHSKYRSKHFTKAGAREYGYAPRTRAYTARKFRTYGHRRPLVFTGISEIKSMTRKIRATSKSMRVIINAPTLSRPGRGKRKLDMRDEMTRVSAREARAMVNRFRQGFERRLKPSNTTRMKRVA